MLYAICDGLTRGGCSGGSSGVVPNRQTRYDQTRHDQTRYDQTRYDQTRYDQTRYDQTRHDQTRHDQTRYDAENKSGGLHMKLQITYIHHNCFAIHAQDKTLLFDYPDAAHRPAKADALVRELLQSANAYIFVSHGHGDHFTPEITELASLADRAGLVLSDDVADLYGEHFERFDRVWTIEPDETTPVDDMQVEGFESTDMGVGFLVTINGAAIYFGGDVAEWVWPEQDESSQLFARNHFGEVLAQLAEKRIDIAFSNADKRLPDWAGGARFVRVVRPWFFVPMHTFGDTATLEQFAGYLGETETTLLRYEKMGDVMEVEV